jgi:RNA polymerase sigma factor (sigma-70 family)
MKATEFDNLLNWLDSAPERAARKYEEIRQSLIKIFIWRGYPDAEGLADETIERVTRRVAEIAPMYSGDPAQYFYGVAKRVMMEPHRRRDISLDHAVPDEVASQEAGQEDQELHHQCLEMCLQALSPGDRKLIINYYEASGRDKVESRKRLALERGMKINELRVYVYRIRLKLRKCFEQCIQRAG